MADLTNKYIYETFPSVVGIGDKGSEGVTGTLKPLTDGIGVHMPIEVSLDEVNITASNTTTVQLNIAGYGEVIDSNGNWTGGGGGGGGAQGAQGPTGAQGAAGFVGSNGAQGAPGIEGAQGSIGAQGAEGAQGATGSQGVAGAQGIEGAQGATGVGTTGAQGSAGANGAQGIEGAQGAVGPSGGPTGAQGATGANGAQGATGMASGLSITNLTPSTPVTGFTTVSTVVQSFLIPANSVTPGNIYNLNWRFGATKVVSGNTVLSAFIGTTPGSGGLNLCGAGQVLTTLTGTAITASITRQFFVNSPTSTNIVAVANNGTDWGISSSGIAFANIDWTVNQYITVLATQASASNSVFSYGYSFYQPNGSIGAQGAVGPSGGPTGAQGAPGTNSGFNYYGAAKNSTYAGGRPTSSFYKTSQLITSAPTFTAPIPDQNANRAFISPLYVTPGQIMTEIAVPMGSTVGDTLHFGIYESTYANGGPQTLIRSNVVTLDASVTGFYKTFSLSTPLTIEVNKTYWVAAMVNLSSASTQICCLSRDGIAGAQWVTTQTITSDPTTTNIFPYNVYLYDTAGTLPVSFAESTASNVIFSGRDEALIVLWK